MNRLQSLQLDLAARFDGADECQYVTVHAVRPRSSEELAAFEDALQQSLAGGMEKNGKVGLTVIVHMPEARVTHPHIPGPQADLVFRVHVLEDVLTNEGPSGSGVPAEYLALSLLNLGHLWKSSTAQVFFADTDQLKPLQLDPAKTTASVGYEIAFRCPLAVSPLPLTATPTIAVDAGVVTLACATGGADVVYSIDGSFPSREGSSTYSAPFASPAPGSLLRVAAYIDGKAGSHVAEHQF